MRWDAPLRESHRIEVQAFRRLGRVVRGCSAPARPSCTSRASVTASAHRWRHSAANVAEGGAWSESSWWNNGAKWFGTLVVDPDDEILAITGNGVMIRVPVSEVSEQGRAASGVKVMNPDPGDQVVAVALVGEEINGNGDTSDAGDPDGAEASAGEEPGGQ